MVVKLKISAFSLAPSFHGLRVLVFVIVSRSADETNGDSAIHEVGTKRFPGEKAPFTHGFENLHATLPGNEFSSDCFDGVRHLCVGNKISYWPEATPGPINFAKLKSNYRGPL